MQKKALKEFSIYDLSDYKSKIVEYRNKSRKNMSLSQVIWNSLYTIHYPFKCDASFEIFMHIDLKKRLHTFLKAICRAFAGYSAVFSYKYPFHGLETQRGAIQKLSYENRFRIRGEN